jgi:Zn-dependent protease
MDLILILLLGFAFKLGWIPHERERLVTIALAFVLHLLISALILNLLPIPPLDGFQAIAPWLPAEIRERLSGLSNMGMFIVLIALWFIPSFNLAFWNTVRSLSSLFDVEPIWIAQGYRAFKFWGH